jgi:hypothetical protein
MDLTSAERKDYDEALDQIEFSKFVTALTGERFKKRRPAILGKLAAEDLMLKVNRGLKIIITGDAAWLICQAVSEGDEAFFKALTRTAVGKECNPGGLDKYNTVIARLIYDGNTRRPEKIKKDFPQMEPNFRVYRERLLDALPPEYQFLDHRKKKRNRT